MVKVLERERDREFKVHSRIERELESAVKLLKLKKERERGSTIYQCKQIVSRIYNICTVREERQYSQTKCLLHCSPDFRSFVVALFQPYTPGSNVPLHCG